MALSERITSIDDERSWKDKIPLHYEYTAGVAGERFLRGLQEGRILASRCAKCGKKYLPPKMYCTDCFLKITRYHEVGPHGVVAALTESHVDFQGRRRSSPVTMAFVTFQGVTGGLIKGASGRGLKIGSKVAPSFKPKGKRVGSLSDIREFRVVRV